MCACGCGGEWRLTGTEASRVRGGGCRYSRQDRVYIVGLFGVDWHT